MPSSCWAPNCVNRLSPGTSVKMYRFPVDRTRLDKWLVAIGRVCGEHQASTRRDGLLEPKDHDRLCSAHFVSGKPSTDPLDVDFKPTIFQHTPKHKKQPGTLKRSIDRHNRVKQRSAKRAKQDAALTLLQLSIEEPTTTLLDNPAEPTPAEQETGLATQTDILQTNTQDTQTDIKMHDTDRLQQEITRQENLNEKLTKKVENLKHEVLLHEQIENTYMGKTIALETTIKELQHHKTQLETKHRHIMQNTFHFDHNLIRDDDEKTKYYTGIPNYATFLTVFNHCSLLIITKKRAKLSLLDQFFICLVKLRHNTGLEDFAHRYKLSMGTVTNIFHTWLDALFRTLSGLIIWPDTDYVQLPECFRTEDFKKVKCIIDCTEIFIDRPSSLKARTQTYSNYKKHNTVKFLIGISPSGAITFLSKAWGGRASDKKITLEEGFLSKLNPGDAVMADRGFIMQDEFAMRQMKLIMPAFTKGKRQLSPVEVEKSRQLARARIHVERVIGRTKNFKILRDTLPITLIKKSSDDVPTIEKIMTVIAAIINMCSPIL